MKNILGVDWEKMLPEQLFEYLERCGCTITDFQKDVIKKMIVNALRQNGRTLTPLKE